MKTETNTEKFERIADEQGILRKHIPAAIKGHNSNRVGGVAADQLRSIINRVEKLEEEKANIAADIRDVYAESKAHGFENKAIRAIIKIRKMETSEREEQETILDTYLNALGMLSDTPLGDAAIAAATEKRLARAGL